MHVIARLAGLWLGDIEQIIVTARRLSCCARSQRVRCDTFASGPIKCMRHVAGTPFNWRVALHIEEMPPSRLVGEQYIIILFVCDSSFALGRHITIREFNESARLTHSLPNFHAHFVVCNIDGCQCVY